MTILFDQAFQAQTLFNQAFQAHQAGDLSAACRLYDAVLAVDPDHVDALRRLGVALYQTGDLAGALERLDRAAARRPHAVEVLRPRGAVLMAAGRLDDAADAFREALEHDPDDAETAFNLGLAERQLGRFERALPLLRQAVATGFSGLAVAHYELALALHLAGTAGEAIAGYRRTLELQSDHAAAHTNLGVLLQGAGDHDGALAAYRAALSHQPDFAPARDNLASALEAQRQRQAPPPLHIMIGTPCFGGNLTDHYAISLLKLQAVCIERGIKLSFCLLHGDALITRARNSVVAEFLRDTTATHLLFIDADIGFSPAQVFRLLEADKEMSAAVYPVKRLDWPRIRRDARTGEPDVPTSALDYVVEFIDPAGKPSPGPVAPVDGWARARYVGTGFLLVRRAVFGRMAARYPEIKYRRSHATADADVDPDALYAFFDCRIDPESGVYLSEDFTFCQRWVEMGGEIWVDLRSRLTHIGRLAFEGNLTERYRHLLPGGAGEAEKVVAKP